MEFIENLLLKCGVNPAVKGFPLLVEAIQMRMNEPDAKLVAGIYAGVAKRHNSTTRRVERNIRSAIERAIDGLSPDVFYEVLGQGPSLDGNITSGTFIALCALQCSRYLASKT